MQEQSSEQGTSPIHVKSIIEVLGKPREHVEKALQDYVTKISDEKGIDLKNKEFAKTEEKDNMFLTFAELDFVAKDVSTLISYCFEYMPSSIEVMSPESITYKDIEVTGFLNDLQARLHTVDMIVKQLKGENSFLRRNMQTLLQNLVFLLLKPGSLTLDQLNTYTGVSKDELEKFIEIMVKEGKIQKDQDSYTLVLDGTDKKEG